MTIFAVYCVKTRQKLSPEYHFIHGRRLRAVFCVLWYC